jgi:hypothetical protein
VAGRLAGLEISGTRVGARPNFRSDSLISLVYQNPRPSFALVKSLGFSAGPFQWVPSSADERAAQ